MIEIREVKFDSSEYLQAWDLRYKVLREPLGLQFTPEDKIKDSRSIHIVAISDGNVVGTLSLTAVSTEEIKMRQVAIDSEIQGAGIGKKLVLHSETYALKNGFKTMSLNARVTAVPFYERLGYIAEPGVFNEVGIPHRKMHKILG